MNNIFSKLLSKHKNVLDTRTKNDWLHNVYVLYAVFLLAVADFFFALQSRDFATASVFAAVGILTSFISKNMVVILCMSMASAFIFRLISGKRQGFEDTDIPVDDTTGGDGQENHDNLENLEDKDENKSSGVYLSKDYSTNSKKKKSKKHKKMPYDEDEDLEEQLRELKRIEKNTNSKNVNKVLENQDELMKEMAKYQPLMKSMQNIMGNLGIRNNDDDSDDE